MRQRIDNGNVHVITCACFIYRRRSLGLAEYVSLSILPIFPGALTVPCYEPLGAVTIGPIGALAQGRPASSCFVH